MIKIIIFFATYLLINQILIKTKYLIDKQQISDHKKKIFTKLNTPLSGGLFFVIIFTYFFF